MLPMRVELMELVGHIRAEAKQAAEEYSNGGVAEVCRVAIKQERSEGHLNDCHFGCWAFHVTSGFDMSLNSQVKFKVPGFGACSGCLSYKYCSGR